MHSQMFELNRMASIASNYCTYFHAGDNYRHFYPYRLQRPKKANWKRREMCTEYILDSGLGNEDVTNEGLLDLAHELQATYVVPKDYLHDQERTTESVREFMELYEDHPCVSEPLVPLQPPHDEHHEVLSGFRAYAIGGVKDEADSDKIAAARRMRDVAGNAYLHGFGFGPTEEMLRTVRENPDLLDSMDSSTLETNLKFDKIQDANHTVHDFKMPRGNRPAAVYGSFISSSLMLVNYMITPLCNNEEFEQLATSAMEW